jgi:SAM-dependent methyltransferase
VSATRIPAYDEIGTGYARRRRVDPRLAAPLHSALGGARRVLNVGAGTGSYEPGDRLVVALEPSSVMIRQRCSSLGRVIQGQAESMPFATRSFDAVMAVLTAHHWSDRQAGFAELRRIAQRRVVLTFDPQVHNRMWLMDYLPEIRDLRSARGLTIDEVVYGVGGGTVTTLPVAHDCPDGMTAAFWRRPEAYLDPEVRLGSSALRELDSIPLERGLARLDRDLRTGAWARRYGHLLELDEFDCGLRLVVGQDPLGR